MFANFNQCLLFLAAIAILILCNVGQIKWDKKNGGANHRVTTENQEGVIKSTRTVFVRPVAFSWVEIVLFGMIFIDTLVMWLSKRPYFREEMWFIGACFIATTLFEEWEFGKNTKRSALDWFCFLGSIGTLVYFVAQAFTFWPTMIGG